SRSRSIRAATIGSRWPRRSSASSGPSSSSTPAWSRSRSRRSSTSSRAAGGGVTTRRSRARTASRDRPRRDRAPRRRGGGARDRELGALVARTLVARGLESQALIASFSVEVLRAARDAVPTLRLMGLDDDETRDQSGDRFDGLSPFGWGADYWFVESAPESVA